jgi:hypothetical protein
MSDDGSRFTYSLLWEDHDGRPWSVILFFDTPVQGRRAHDAACEGHWLKPGMVEPHVSALRIKKGGRLLAEELKPKADWCGEHEKFGCRCAVKEAA